MRKLIIRLQAQHDIEAAAVWYENQRSVLGTEFLEEVEPYYQKPVSIP
jgi:hypothetical protein